MVDGDYSCDYRSLVKHFNKYITAIILACTLGFTADAFAHDLAYHQLGDTDSHDYTPACLKLKLGPVRNRVFKFIRIASTSAPGQAASQQYYILRDLVCNKVYTLRSRRSGPQLNFPAGSTVRVNGAFRGQLITVSNQDSVIAIKPLSLEAVATTGNRSILVITANFKDRALTCTDAQIAEKMKGSSTDPSISNVAGLFSEMSGNRLNFNNIRVLGRATLSNISASTCNINTWASLLYDLAYYNGYAPYLYDHIVYVLPPNGCPAGGYGESPGRYSWNFSCDTSYVFGHELGHNLGMGHAGSPTYEYGDTRDIMGTSYKLSHVNALHKAAQGWLDRSSVTITNPTVAQTFSLTPFDSPSTSTAPLIVSASILGSTYYFTYRANKGQYYIPEGADNSFMLEIHKSPGAPSGADTLKVGELYDYYSWQAFLSPPHLRKVFHRNTVFPLVGIGMNLAVTSMDQNSANLALSPMTVSGIVTSSNGRPLEGITVWLGSLLAPLQNSTRTDSSGHYEFSTNSTDLALLTVADSRFFSPLSTFVQFLSLGDKNIAQNVQSHVAAYSITGSVISSQGPLAGIHLNLSGPVSRTFVTSQDGSYDFNSLPPGDYIVSAEDPNLNYFFYPAEYRVSVTDADLQLMVNGVHGNIYVSPPPPGLRTDS